MSPPQHHHHSGSSPAALPQACHTTLLHTYERTHSEIVRDVNDFKTAYNNTSDGYLRDWLQARWVELRELEALRTASDAARKEYDSITDYKKLGRDKSISLVDGKLGESEQELVAQTQAQDHARNQADRAYHAAMYAAAFTRKSKEEELLRILEASKSIRSKTVEVLTAHLRKADGETMQKCYDTNKKVYRNISNPPPAVPQPIFDSEDLTGMFDQTPGTGSDRHGESNSLSKTCFHPISRRSLANL